MKQPRVTAVIVNYNTGGLLRKAVDSLLAGSVRPRIEIVDNASSDDSLEQIRRDPAYEGRLSVTINAGNRGFASANNQILRSRGADYYLLMNPDCVLEPGALEAFIAHMERNAGTGLAGGALKNPDGTIQKTSKRRFPTPLSGLARTLGLHRMKTTGRLSDFDLAREPSADDREEAVEAVSGALMFVRDTALDRVGLLDEAYFMHCEDLDWCRRFRDAGYDVVYVPAAGAIHAKGGSGRGPKVVWHLHRGMLRFYSKHHRHDYPLIVTALVHAAVYARCFLLMGASVIRRSR